MWYLYQSFPGKNIWNGPRSVKFQYAGILCLCLISTVGLFAVYGIDIAGKVEQDLFKTMTSKLHYVPDHSGKTQLDPIQEKVSRPVSVSHLQPLHYYAFSLAVVVSRITRIGFTMRTIHEFQNLVARRSDATLPSRPTSTKRFVILSKRIFIHSQLCLFNRVASRV